MTWHDHYEERGEGVSWDERRVSSPWNSLGTIT